MKKCSKCKLTLNEDDFYKHNRNCKKCHLENMKNYHSKNKDKVDLGKRKRSLFKKYGVSLEQYDDMLHHQNGECAICKSKDVGRKGAKYFNVDHCHSTGKVRGLLCHNCNIILGKIKDSKEWLSVAIKYLD